MAELSHERCSVLIGGARTKTLMIFYIRPTKSVTRPPRSLCGHQTVFAVNYQEQLGLP